MSSISILTRAPRLSDDVAEGLIAAIQSHEFVAGSRLPAERELAERFGVSRIVIREAMARLKSDGVVESRQGAGAFVATDGAKVPFRIGSAVGGDLRELFELRVAVESAAAAMAARNVSQRQMIAIEEALVAMRCDVEAGRNGTESDRAFHAAIATASQNQYIDRFIGFLGLHLRTAISTARSNTASKLPQSILSVQAEHERIYDAILERNPVAAEAAMKLHLQNALNRLFPSPTEPGDAPRS